MIYKDLIRIEYKLDLIIQALQESGVMLKSLPSLEGIEQDTCVLCNSPIKITINTEEERLVRSCSCKLPKSYTPGLKDLIKESSYASSKQRNPDHVPSDREEKSSGNS